MKITAEDITGMKRRARERRKQERVSGIKRSKHAYFASTISSDEIIGTINGRLGRTRARRDKQITLPKMPWEK